MKLIVLEKRITSRLLAIFASALIVAAAGHWTTTAAQDPAPALAPGNLLLSTSEYQGVSATVTVGQALPGATVTAFSSAGADTTHGAVKSASTFVVNGPVLITTKDGSFHRTVLVITPVPAHPATPTSFTLTWDTALPNPVAKGDSILPLASADGSYPGVWANEAADPSFGITSPIFLHELTADANGTEIGTKYAVDATKMTTSFPSKSEMSLHQSQDGTIVTFMGYNSPINTLDVSNSNTPGHVDATNPVTLTFQRAVGQVDNMGNLQVTDVNDYSGNNGRSAVLANGLYFMVGNAGNGSGTEPLGVVNNTGVQAVVPGASGETTVVGAQRHNGTSTCVPVSANGCEYGFTLSDVLDPLSGPPLVIFKDDKSGKDDNFRGIQIFGNSMYVTKGSGSNGIDTVFQVGDGTALPTIGAGGTAASTIISVANGFPTESAREYAADATLGLDGYYPFGMWLANADTMYVADEGSGSLPSDATDNPHAGLQKWVRSGGTWSLAYTLQSGLNLGTPYMVAGYTFNPSPGGLRNITGRLNDDGTATIWGVTSTTSTDTDQGADPNQLVVITDNVSAPGPTAPAEESFTLVRTAGFGEVFRGVSFTPGTINPTWSISVNPPANGAGWNNSNVTVQLTASLADGTIDAIHYTLAGAQNETDTDTGNMATTTISTEGTTTLQFYASNAEGSRSATRSLSPSIMLDKTPPSITFPGNTGAYTVDQTISISCMATDALSGVASNTCPTASGPAYTFPLGLNLLPASATDFAGNTANVTGKFTVSVTFDSLANLTEQFINQNGIANSLVAKLSAAAKSNTKNGKTNQLNAYTNEVSAQSGKALTAEQAAILIYLAGQL